MSCILSTAESTPTPKPPATVWDSTEPSEGDAQDKVMIGFMKFGNLAHRCKAGRPRRACRMRVENPADPKILNVWATAGGKCWHADPECLSLAGRDGTRFNLCDGRTSSCIMDVD